MAYTQTQIDALESAISQGVRKVEYDGQSVTYNSLSEMQTQLSIMKRELSGETAKRIVFGTGRGLR